MQTIEHPTDNTFLTIAPSRAKTSGFESFRSRRTALSLVLVATLAAVALCGTSEVSAATNGKTTANVNLRAGPGAQYPVVVALPQNAPIAVHGCLADRSWCDIGWGGNRGWVAASYIQGSYDGQQTVLTPAIAPRCRCRDGGVRGGLLGCLLSRAALVRLSRTLDPGLGELRWKASTYQTGLCVTEASSSA
ncbi:SH3 domain protein [Rhizobium sp. CF080]|nr:SH3 domain protein [Rhizobium sp. CF080]